LRRQSYGNEAFGSRDSLDVACSRLASLRSEHSTVLLAWLAPLGIPGHRWYAACFHHALAAFSRVRAPLSGGVPGADACHIPSLPPYLRGRFDASLGLEQKSSLRVYCVRLYLPSAPRCPHASPTSLFFFYYRCRTVSCLASGHNVLASWTCTCLLVQQRRYSL